MAAPPYLKKRVGEIMMGEHRRRSPTLRTMAAAWFALATLAGTVVAGPFEDAISAYDRGDNATALRLLRPLAEEGRADAETSLGAMYDNGNGVAQNYAEAVKWYRKAADQGYAQAQNKLGLLYYDGNGVPKNYVQAYKWFDLAASKYETSESLRPEAAIQNRDRVAAKMTPSEVEEAQRLVREWKPQ
jgi:TPR repeat protein